MNYFFTPFTLVNQYQPYYAFSPQILVQTKAYYIQEAQYQKQILATKQNTFSFEPQDAFKTKDYPIQSPKKTRKLKKKQDKSFGFREQDKQRNIFSNILKGFLSALTEKRLMDPIVSKILVSTTTNVDLQKFMKNVTQIFHKCRSYFSPKSVRQILRQEKDDKQIRNTVIKCLYKYLKTEFSINLLISNRIKRKSKLLQMKKARQLISILMGSE